MKGTTRSIHFMGTAPSMAELAKLLPTIEPAPPPVACVWNYEGFLKVLQQSDGVVTIDAKAALAIGEFMGLKVFADPKLPEGRIELRNPDGSIAARFDLK